MNLNPVRNVVTGACAVAAPCLFLGLTFGSLPVGTVLQLVSVLILGAYVLAGSWLGSRLGSKVEVVFLVLGLAFSGIAYFAGLALLAA